MVALVVTTANVAAQQPEVCKRDGKRCVETAIEFQGWVNADKIDDFVKILKKLCEDYIEVGVPPSPPDKGGWFPMSLDQADFWVNGTKTYLERCLVYQPGKPGGWSKQKGFRDELLRLIDKYVQSKENASVKPYASLTPLIAAQGNPVYVGGKFKPQEDGNGGP
jgi:hypothetical protein